MIQLNDIRRHLFNKEALIHLVIWGLFFSMLNVAWTSNWFHRTAEAEAVMPLSVCYFFALFYANALWFIPRYFKTKTWYQYLMVIMTAAVIPEMLRAMLAIITSHQNFSGSIYAEINSRDSFIFGIPNAFWFAFVLSSAYRFIKDWLVNTRTIERLQKEKMAMELEALKSQINPHFLFNNLNALDDLIDRDKTKAKEYLHKLSSILRYSIASTENDVVSLKDEWRFINDYIFLIEERFGGAYKFDKVDDLMDMDGYLIPPASLPTLLENLVKHNQGSMKEPLVAMIKLDESGITVSHEKRLTNGTTNNLGTGLKNIKSRYKLLSNKEVTIVNDKIFSVTLPLIKQVK